MRHCIYVFSFLILIVLILSRCGKDTVIYTPPAKKPEDTTQTKHPFTKEFEGTYACSINRKCTSSYPSTSPDTDSDETDTLKIQAVNDYTINDGGSINCVFYAPASDTANGIFAYDGMLTKGLIRYTFNRNIPDSIFIYSGYSVMMLTTCTVNGKGVKRP